MQESEAGGVYSYICQHQFSDLILCKWEHRLEENRDTTIWGDSLPYPLRPVLLTLPLKEERNLTQKTSQCQFSASKPLHPQLTHLACFNTLSHHDNCRKALFPEEPEKICQ